MTLPSDVPVGTVTGTLTRAVGPGPTLQAVPVVGTVTFTANLGGNRYRDTTSTPPELINLDPVTVTIGAGGVLPPTQLVSGGTDWTWTVTFNLAVGVRWAPYSFYLPAGGTVDLTTVAPVVVASGVSMVIGPEGPAGPAGSGVTNNATDLTSGTLNAARLPDLSGTYARSGRKTVTVYDEFSRYADGALAGKVPSVGAAWVTTGAQPTVVTSGKATSTGTGYMIQTLTERFAAITTEVVWSGTGTAAAMAMGGAVALESNVDNLVPHLNFGPDGFACTIHRDGGTFDLLFGGNVNWEKPAPVDGTTICRYTMLLREGTLVIIGPTGDTYSCTDPRIAAFTGVEVFWEPMTSGGTVAGLVSVGASVEATTGEVSQLDMAGLAAPPRLGNLGALVGNPGTAYEVSLGVEQVSALPGITFGPYFGYVYTQITAAASVGDTVLHVADLISSGTSCQIDSGAGSEIVVPTPNLGGYPLGPYTLPVAALAKAHPVGTAVIITGCTKTHVYVNSGFLILPPTTALEGGALYFSNAFDTYLTEAASGVLAQAPGNVFRTGQGVTGSRPSAVTVGDGAQFYDTTLKQPIFSDGAAWRDAMKNLV